MQLYSEHTNVSKLMDHFKLKHNILRFVKQFELIDNFIILIVDQILPFHCL